MSRKVRVLIVEDSFLMRKFLKEILEEDPDIKVVGMAKDGKEALKLLENLDPDVITLDYEMPGLNGIEVLERIMKKRPIPCIMVSAYTKEGAEVTLEALSRGAFDFVPKPSGELSLDIIKVRDELIGKIKASKGAKLKNIVKEYEDLKRPLSGTPASIDAVGIASSTGGTTVVEYLFRNLPGDLNIPVFVVQHMPVVFTKKFAKRLSEITGKDVRETEHGEKVEKNTYYIAKGGTHMALKKKGRDIYIVHRDLLPKNGVKPSADYLFESMAEVYGERSLGIILTGMGKDGVEGAKKIKNKGGLIWTQSKETCLIFGMPKNAIKEKIVDKVFSPEEIVKNLVKM